MNENFILSMMEKFDSSSIASLELKIGGDFLSLKKKDAVCASFPQNDFQSADQPSAAQIQDEPRVSASESSSSRNSESNQRSSPKSDLHSAPQDENLVQIKSPIVGTFYRAPSPDSPVYVEEGKSVKKGDPLCILEAMKMMNTLECEFDCTIEKILVQNGDLVEFDQPLFLARK